jgi:hypothetical protein
VIEMFCFYFCTLDTLIRNRKSCKNKVSLYVLRQSHKICKKVISRTIILVVMAGPRFEVKNPKHERRLLFLTINRVQLRILYTLRSLL